MYNIYGVPSCLKWIFNIHLIHSLLTIVILTIKYHRIRTSVPATLIVPAWGLVINLACSCLVSDQQIMIKAPVLAQQTYSHRHGCPSSIIRSWKQFSRKLLSGLTSNFACATVTFPYARWFLAVFQNFIFLIFYKLYLFPLTLDYMWEWKFKKTSPIK